MDEQWKGMLLGGLEGGLGVYSQILERDLAEEAEIRRQQNLNEVSRTNAWQQSSSGYVTEQGQEIPQWKLKDYQGVKIASTDFARDKARQDAQFAQETQADLWRGGGRGLAGEKAAFEREQAVEGLKAEEGYWTSPEGEASRQRKLEDAIAMQKAKGVGVKPKGQMTSKDLGDARTKAVNELKEIFPFDRGNFSKELNTQDAMNQWLGDIEQMANEQVNRLYGREAAPEQPAALRGAPVEAGPQRISEAGMGQITAAAIADPMALQSILNDPALQGADRERFLQGVQAGAVDPVEEGRQYIDPVLAKLRVGGRYDKLVEVDGELMVRKSTTGKTRKLTKKEEEDIERQLESYQKASAMWR